MKPWSNTTIRNLLLDISGLFKRASERGWLGGNPVKEIVIPPKNRPREILLDDSEKTLLLDACYNPAFDKAAGKPNSPLYTRWKLLHSSKLQWGIGGRELRDICFLALTYGFRLGEINGVKNSNHEYETAGLRVGRNLKKEKDGSYTLAIERTKIKKLVGKEGIRKTTIPNCIPAVVEIIERNGKGKQAGELIFGKDITKAWEAVREFCQFDKTNDAGQRVEICFKDLRKTAANDLLLEFNDVALVANILGHTELDTLYKHYQVLIQNKRTADKAIQRQASMEKYILPAA